MKEGFSFFCFFFLAKFMLFAHKLTVCTQSHLDHILLLRFGYAVFGPHL